MEVHAFVTVAEALVEGDRSFVFGHDPQVGVFIRVDDGVVECLSEPGAVRVVEGVQVREFAGACGQFGEVVGAFEFPGGRLAQGERQTDRLLPVDLGAHGAGEPAVGGPAGHLVGEEAAHGGGGEVAVEVFEVFVAFGAVAGGEAFPERVKVDRVVGLLHAVQLQVDVFFGVGRFNRCERVAALTYKSHGF